MNGEAVVSDFMMSKVLAEDTEDPAWATTSVAKSIRWLPPERLRTPSCLTCEGDVYSFAMTTLECFTGRCPFDGFDEIGNGVQQLREHVLNGGRPRRPIGTINGMCDPLWDIITRCWAAEPKDRLSMNSVVTELTSI